ncbi:class II fumarate hydratase [Limnochorda pilosa]|uniref:Fumarate hydratase class II n=1 Tax=Limnochorda pilosa TaxID=1555112 RepID=A0A0K2SFX5_LIMPI|nr:aspartate ammonia-lyase [Limnochorda pilosa]
MSDVRIERDSMGEMEVPAPAYYGASTQRAVLNFPVSGLRFSRSFIRALGLIKLAAAETNMELGQLDRERGEAIVRAAQEVADGKLDAEFVLDIFQTGSGTSTNMNANEVIANRASEILGGERGSRKVHPNDHVNMGQSSNDVIPTAIHLAALEAMERRLLPGLGKLHAGLAEKARAFDDIVKIGRTHLQDATPIRLGQEFSGYASQVEHGIRRVRQAQAELAELALGGTAVGTGINTHPEFARRTIARLAERTGLTLQEAENHFEAQAAKDAAVSASGALKAVAVSLMKIANDIRFLGSGPRCGIGELKIPPVQPGSSIMPGKVNPVIAESVMMVAAQVMGNDLTVTIAAERGNFELNVMMPVLAHNLLESIELLGAAAANFQEKCIAGLEADRQRCESLVEQSLAMVTVLAPRIGYDRAADLAHRAYETGQTIRALCREEKVLPEDELERLLDARSQTEPGRA